MKTVQINLHLYLCPEDCRHPDARRPALQDCCNSRLTDEECADYLRRLTEEGRPGRRRSGAGKCIVEVQD